MLASLASGIVFFEVELTSADFGEMVSPNVEIQKWHEVLRNQALDRNDKSKATWSKYKHDLEETKSLLGFLPKKVKHDVMVPVGPKALMRGKIVHTNEFLVNLGETWFATRTADQTIEICNRRINKCDEMLQKLEKEVELILNKSTLPAKEEAFGSEERPEIIEYVTEEENEEWKVQHRLREKKYRQQLAELRNKEKKKIETEEDLWKRLDDLEAQEELEDELNRLNAQYDSEDITYDNLESDDTFKEENNLVKEVEGDSPEENVKTLEDTKTKKRVSFACDWDSADEPLRLEIKHSKCEPVPSDPDCEKITSPADIYNHYMKYCNKIVPVLKKSKNFNEGNNFKTNQNLETDDIDVEERSESHITSTSFYIKDVVERNIDTSSEPIVNSTAKKISKFKSMRMKNQ